MSFRDAPASVWILLFVPALVLLAGCDVPSSGPSLETETGLNSPVVVNKTFSFLGGPDSQHAPLIDTTTSQFDSLFTVADSDQSIAIEEEVSSFDLGSLDQALDEASGGLGANASIAERVIQGDLGNQEIAARYSQTNGQPAPVPSPGSPLPEAGGLPVTEDTLPFPFDLQLPDYGVASIDAAGVQRGTLTDVAVVNGTDINQITFELVNDDPSSPPLTDGEGEAPSITVRNEGGDEQGPIGTAQFESPIDPGSGAKAVADVKGESLVEDELQLVLNVSGGGSEDELALTLSPLQYKNVTVDGVSTVDIAASSSISTGEDGSSQFAGIEPQKGTMELTLTNDQRFPIDISTLRLENDENTALPDTFETLGISESATSIDPGTAHTFNVDLGGRGVARSVDVTVEAQLAESYGKDTLTVAAGDGLRTDVSVAEDFAVGAMFFWPTGETVDVKGRFDFEADRISFDQSGDFVDLNDGTLAMTHLLSEPDVSFESLDLRLPDLTRQDAPLTVALEGFPETIQEDLSGVRVAPTKNEVSYRLQGTLQDIPESSQTSSTLQVIRSTDEVRADVSVENLGVEALEATVDPFSVDVTEDANGDGMLDLEDPSEVTRESFGDIGDATNNVDGLELQGSELNFQVTTDIGTNAQLYAALQGRGGRSPIYLKGQKEKAVSQNSTRADRLVESGTPIARENLIQFGVNGPTLTAGQSITLTDENSNVDEFVSALPSSLHFVAQARLTGDENNRIRLERPVAFEAGLSATVPVRVRSRFELRDTIDADFSALDDVTDPSKDVTVSDAELRARYANALPMGADAKLFVLDENQNEVLSLPGDGESLRVRPPSKADDGTADGTRTGTATLDLSQDQLHDLAAGRRLALRLTMAQEEGEVATFRATDTIQLSLEASVDASVSVNN